MIERNDHHHLAEFKNLNSLTIGKNTLWNMHECDSVISILLNLRKLNLEGFLSDNNSRDSTNIQTQNKKQYNIHQLKRSSYIPASTEELLHLTRSFQHVKVLAIVCEKVTLSSQIVNSSAIDLFLK